MKAYMVEISTFGVVMAEDEDHARTVAVDHRRDIFADDWNPRVEVDGPVLSEQDLGRGWDGECIPYGGDGETRLHDLLRPSTDTAMAGREGGG